MGKGENIRLGFVLQGLSEARFALGQLEESRRYAEELLAWKGLEDHPAPNFHRYHAHSLLGLIALRSGNTPEAVTHLGVSLRGSTNESIGRRPPELMLARQLLEKGEREAVLEFLRAYADLVPQARSTVGKWIQEIESGRIPLLDEAMFSNRRPRSSNATPKD